MVDISARLKEKFNYNSNGEGKIQGLCFVENINSENIDSSINRFKFY